MRPQTDDRNARNRLTSGSAWPLILLIPILLLTGQASAQDWRFDPVVGVGYEFDDNAELSIRTDSEIEVNGLIADARGTIGYASDRTDFFLTPRVRWRRYDESQFDATDIFVVFNWQYRTPSHTFRLRANGEREAVRTAEQADADPELDDPSNITGEDTGLVLLGGDRDMIWLRPDWNWRLSGVTSLSTSLEVFDVSYDDVFLDLLADYTDAKLEFSLSRAFSPVTRGLLIGSARKYENSDERNEFDGYSVMAGFDRALSEKVDLRVLVGAETAEFTASSLDKETEWVADVSLVRRLETISVLAQYRRSIQANGAAIPLVRDDFFLNFRRQLSEKVTASLGARVYRSKVLASDSDDSRDYIQLRGSIGWNFTPTLSLEFDYRHSIINRGILIGERADSNRVSVWFVYRGDALRDR
jgi:hypothetical protein